MTASPTLAWATLTHVNSLSALDLCTASEGSMSGSVCWLIPFLGVERLSGRQVEYGRQAEPARALEHRCAPGVEGGIKVDGGVE